MTRLDFIEQSVIEWLKRGIPVQETAKAETHALRFLGSVRENRRGLRNFLRAYWSGKHQYLSTHPATAAWYQEHKQFSRPISESGVSIHSDQYMIQIERDPFEILKLGTYAGSCLAVGGICCDSAVAALLDVNMQVLYARDHQGRVVGRQLLTISDDNRLVCFSVYPNPAAQSIKAIFLDYDLALAQALALPLYDPREEGATEYRIGSILSNYWWDDSSWDFQIAK
jgi:hypothetical protein